MGWLGLGSVLRLRLGGSRETDPENTQRGWMCVLAGFCSIVGLTILRHQQLLGAILIIVFVCKTITKFTDKFYLHGLFFVFISFGFLILMSALEFFHRKKKGLEKS